MYAGPLHVYGGRADFRFRKDGSSGRGKRLLGLLRPARKKYRKQRARTIVKNRLFGKRLRPSARRHFVRRESSGTKPCGNGKWLCARPSLSARRHFVRRKSSGTKPCENGKWLCARPGSSVKRLCAKRVRNAGRTWTLPCESSEKSCKRQLQSRKGRYARPSGPGNGHGGVRKRPIGGGGRFFVGGNSRMASSRTGRGWPTGGPDKAVYFGFRCSAVFSSGFPCAPAFRFTGRKWRGSE